MRSYKVRHFDIQAEYPARLLLVFLVLYCAISNLMPISTSACQSQLLKQML